MDYLTATQVSHDYGISTRMLRYYEQIGLLESGRADDYAYRVYGAAAIRRLQQIIILRKLQIPVKQIKAILSNQSAVEAIEIFKQNISALDEKITALSVVKSILTRFVSELQEKTDVRLKLDLLNDTTMLAVVDAFSFPKNTLEEKIGMEELRKANEQLRKENGKGISIVYRPPATMASLEFRSEDAAWGEMRNLKIIEVMVRKFIEDMELFKLKPDMRVFAFGDGSDIDNIWVSIPDDLDVKPPFKKKNYPGGLYAACANPGVDFEITGVGEWVENSDDYEWYTTNGKRAIGWEYFNPFNIYGLEGNGSEYSIELFPVREIKKLTDSEKEKIDTIERNAALSKPVEIDLTTMEKQGDFELSYANGLMTVTNGEMATKQNFSIPLKIQARVKTDRLNIRIAYDKGGMIFNWDDGIQTLLYMNHKTGEWVTYKKRGAVPANEFVDIEYILCKDLVVVKVNCEVRHAGSQYRYIKDIKKNPELQISAPVSIGTFCERSTQMDSTITVEFLRVTEI